MLLGALVDAGADVEAVGATLGGLGLDGWAVTFERVQRGGIAATWANVVTDTHDDEHGDHHPHRPARVITELLAAADLPAPVRATAQRVFDTLAAAEGAVHGIDPADVEFHEVGALDAIVDVVGVAAALHSLGIDRIVAAPIADGPRHDAVGPRRAAQPAARGRPAARPTGGTRRRRRHADGAGHADGCRHPGRDGRRRSARCRR